MDTTNTQPSPQESNPLPDPTLSPATPTPTTNQPPKPTLPKPKPTISKTFIIYAVLIAAIPLAGIIGYAAGLNHREKELPPVTQTKITPTTSPTHPPKPSPTITPTPTKYIDQATANWKSYTSTLYKFSILYPTDWTVKEDQTNNVVIFNPPGADAIAANSSQDNSGAIPIVPQIAISLDNKTTVSNSDWVKPFATNDGVKGDYLTIPGAPTPDIHIELPYSQSDQVLKFSLTSLGQETIYQFNQQNHTQAKDADSKTFETMIKTVKFL